MISIWGALRKIQYLYNWSRTDIYWNNTVYKFNDNTQKV